MAANVIDHPTRRATEERIDAGRGVTPARTLVADPPWLFGDALPGGRGASKHYECLSVAELAGFPLPPLAPDCRLFLWRVAAMQAEALHVIQEWGFTLKSELVWVKTSSEPTGDDPGELPRGRLAFGLGRTVRASHEVCLIATRGRPEALSRSVRSVFFARRTAHSRKPDRFYEIVEQISPGPYVELFARRRRDGWCCYGDELPQLPQREAR